MNKLLPLLLCAIATPSTWAADTAITSIFGGGNPNTGWTALTQNDLQLGLRAKNPVTGATPSNGSGTYTFLAGTPWNFEFSINSNADGAGTSNLTAFAYALSIDTDPSAATVYTTFSPTLYPDNSYGNNGTGNGQGVEGTFASLGSSNNVMQNSEKLSFFPIMGNPNLPGTYDFQLSAFNQAGAPVNQVSMRVIVTGASVPDAGNSAGFLLVALGATALLRRRLSRSK